MSSASMTPSPLESVEPPVVPLVVESTLGMPVVDVAELELELVPLPFPFPLASEGLGSPSSTGGAGWGFRLHAWNSPPSMMMLATQAAA